MEGMSKFFKFEYQDKNKESFVQIALSVLLSSDKFIESMKSFHGSCSRSARHSCLVKDIEQIIENPRETIRLNEIKEKI